LWSHRFFRACALLFSWVNLIWEALFLVLIVAARRQGLSGGEIGLLIAGFGVCSLLGSVAAPRITRWLSMRALVVSGFWLQLGFAVFLLKPSVFVLLAGVLPTAFFTGPVNSAVIGYRTAVVPDRLTGRVGGARPDDRAVHRRARPALGRPAAALALTARDGRRLRGVHAAALADRHVEPSIRNAPSLRDLDDLPRARSEASRAATG